MIQPVKLTIWLTPSGIEKVAQGRQVVENDLYLSDRNLDMGKPPNAWIRMVDIEVDPPSMVDRANATAAAVANIRGQKDELLKKIDWLDRRENEFLAIEMSPVEPEPRPVAFDDDIPF